MWARIPSLNFRKYWARVKSVLVAKNKGAGKGPAFQRRMSRIASNNTNGFVSESKKKQKRRRRRAWFPFLDRHACGAHGFLLLSDAIHAQDAVGPEILGHLSGVRPHRFHRVGS